MRLTHTYIIIHWDLDAIARIALAISLNNLRSLNSAIGLDTKAERTISGIRSARRRQPALAPFSVEFLAPSTDAT